MRERPHGIMFHHFHDEYKHPKGQGSISGSEFKELIVSLKNNYNLLSAIEWLKKSEINALQPRDICITFDDNLLCQYEIALPILEELNIKAFWFVYSSPLEGVQEKIEIYRYFRSVKFDKINDFYEGFNSIIDQSDIKDEVAKKLRKFNVSKFLSDFPFYSVEDKIFRYTRDWILGQERYYDLMDKMIAHYDLDINSISLNLWNNESKIKNLHNTGHIIGLHSHSHPTELKKLTKENQFDEYNKNKKALTAIIGDSIKTMSHPCNSYNEETLKILKDLNVNFGFRANMEPGYNSSLEYPRIDHALLLNKK